MSSGVQMHELGLFERLAVDQIKCVLTEGTHVDIEATRRQLFDGEDAVEDLL